MIDAPTIALKVVLWFLDLRLEVATSQRGLPSLSSWDIVPNFEPESFFRSRELMEALIVSDRSRFIILINLLLLKILSVWMKSVHCGRNSAKGGHQTPQTRGFFHARLCAETREDHKKTPTQICHPQSNASGGLLKRWSHKTIIYEFENHTSNGFSRRRKEKLRIRWQQR